MVKKAVKQAPGTPDSVGLDIGYGFIKAVSDQQTVVFPSVMGFARDLGFQAEKITASHPGDQLSDEDGDWFIGKLAQQQLSVAEQLNLRGRTANEEIQGNVFRVRMAKAAIGKLYPGRRNGEIVHIRIATGLPVDHMADAPELKAALIGQHRIKTDQTDFVLNVTEVMCMPQAYGAIYRMSLLETGEDDPCYIHDTTAVLDIGTYTVDLALDKAGEYIRRRSGSRESGVHIVHQRIAEQYNADYRSQPSVERVDEILKTGCFKIAGKPVVSYTPVVQAAIEPLKAATENLLNEKLGVGDDVDVIFMVGGGAHLIYPSIKLIYPQTELVEMAQLANAQGYLYYARFAQRD